jgi:hypothetical protein
MLRNMAVPDCDPGPPNVTLEDILRAILRAIGQALNEVWPLENRQID